MATRSQDSRLVIKELSHRGRSGRGKKSGRPGKPPAARAPSGAARDMRTARAGAVARVGATARVASAMVTVRDLVRRGARRLNRARVFYGHGTDNALDESAALVFHALNLSHDAGEAAYGKRVSADAQQRVEALITRRIVERIPAVYLTNVTWFA